MQGTSAGAAGKGSCPRQRPEIAVVQGSWAAVTRAVTVSAAVLPRGASCSGLSGATQEPRREPPWWAPVKTRSSAQMEGQGLRWVVNLPGLGAPAGAGCGRACRAALRGMLGGGRLHQEAGWSRSCPLGSARADHPQATARARPSWQEPDRSVRVLGELVFPVHREPVSPLAGTLGRADHAWPGHVRVHTHPR